MPSTTLQAAVTGLPSRRAAFATLAGAGAALALPKAVRAAEHPDARLLALHAEWKVSADEDDHAADALVDAYQRAVRPELPEALFRRLSDGRFFFGFQGTVGDDGRFWYGHRDSLDFLRGWNPERVGIVAPDVAAASVARCNEILTAHAAWRRAIAAEHDACGVSAAQVAQQATAQRNRTLRQTIIRSPAATVAGLLVKLRVAHWCNAEWVDDFEARLESGDASDEAMLASALRDALALAVQQEGVAL